METSIANYLFANKKYIVPSIGVLRIKNVHAVSIFGEQSIAAPTSIIEFEQWQGEDSTGSEIPTAFDLLSTNINELKLGENIDIPYVGKFFRDEQNKINFTAFHIPVQFFPPVNAQRVTHPHDSHNMLVGETQTNTSAMAEYYSNEVSSKKNKWWLWAIVLFAIALGAIIFYINQNGEKLILVK